MKRAGGPPSQPAPDPKRTRVENGAPQPSAPTPGLPTTAMTPDQIKALMETTKRQLEERKQQLGLARPLAAPISLPLAAPPAVLGSIPSHPNPVLAQSQALAAQLRAQVTAQLAAQQAKLGGLGMAGMGLGAQKPPTAVKLDDQGRLVDAEGKVVAMPGRVTTLKANLKEEKRKEMDAAKEAKPPDLQDNNPYFDPRLTVPKTERQKRTFKFADPGKFENMAQRLRAQAQMERLQNEIAQAAKKTGISSATKLALLTPKTSDIVDAVPKVEWWDMAILPSGTYDDLDAVGLTVPQMNGTCSEMETDEEGANSKLKALGSLLKGITSLVEHPIPIEPPAEAPKNIVVPVYLTKEEKKKLRRQRRREAEQEKQEKIRMGLMPPPDPKLKISNLMRVLGDEAVMEPSKAEAKVREQIKKRKEAHEAANEARKLTDEQRGEKRDKKLTEDLSVQSHVAIFRVKDLSDPAKKYKVDVNAQQLKLTGVVLVSPDANAVIVEGGPKSIKKYKSLMLRRIKWSEDKVKQRDGDPEDEAEDNKCYLVWEGIVKHRTFPDWKFEKFSQSQRVRDYLKKMKVEHYWDLVLTEAIVEPDVDNVL
eukprot:comp23789_c0_seq1/m.41295 comp23789_c0_seq1/g.41295  ORF comp23789_c0_seq1/g.41295 comp23789_c0_seq1/m.41295 type:complete len:592 (-) comp23789_c0_seq1:82-1857(-)